MIFSSSLSDDSATYVVDTSVIINLQHCKIGKAIMQCIGNRIVIPEVATKEGTLNQYNEHLQTREFLIDLLESGLVQQISLSDRETKEYNRLMREERSLHDGETGTIVLAKLRG